MRRVSSSLQNRNVATGDPVTEQCMQKQCSRNSSALRSSPRHAPRWFLVLVASLAGFIFLIGIWIWLPPSTVLGVTAQAQAQQHAQAQAQARAHDHAPPDATGAHRSEAIRAAHSEAEAASGAHAVAAGSSLYKQAQQQLQQQKQQRAEAAAGAAGHSGSSPGQGQQGTHQSLQGTGRGSFRGGGGSSSGDSRVTPSGGGAMSSPATHQQLQQRGAGAAAVPTSARVVVVGGGLAGLVAALQAAECLAAADTAAGAAHGAAVAANGAASCPATNCSGGGGGLRSSPYSVGVLVVDKMPKLGGNSAKASSGINALHTAGGDSEEVFRADVEASGGGASKPELVAELVRGSHGALAYLEAHGVVLPGVTRLGGHTVARTRTVSGGANVGWVAMSALIAAAKTHPGIRVLEGHSLRRIMTSEAAGGAVTGVELAAAGGPDGTAPAAGSDPSSGVAAQQVSCAALVLATGGFAANKELLKTVAPEAADLATTNGPWARGEALDLAAAAGAALVGLPDVQVHPTGFVDPAEPGAGTKFLAPEKLRGVGGLLLDEQGVRFVDELARRDVVSGAMMALPDRTAWLLLGRDASAEYGVGALDFYCKKGLMRKAENLAQAAEVVGIPEQRLRGELAAYVTAAVAATGGGGAPDPYGKRVFPHPPDPVHQLPMYLAKVTPVVHYTMGGVAINTRAEVLRAGAGEGAVVRGLYAAGEVAGGLHGRNRLGGNSLLECAVFGRIAGAQAATCSPA